MLFSEDGGNMSYTNHKEGTQKCEKRKSYIKWYSDTLCTNRSTGQHWTSIKQESRVFNLTIYGRIIFSLYENLMIVCNVL